MSYFLFIDNVVERLPEKLLPLVAFFSGYKQLFNDQSPDSAFLFAIGEFYWPLLNFSIYISILFSIILFILTNTFH